jgi:hypothetical protein
MTLDGKIEDNPFNAFSTSLILYCKSMNQYYIHLKKNSKVSCNSATTTTIYINNNNNNIRSNLESFLQLCIMNNFNHINNIRTDFTLIRNSTTIVSSTCSALFTIAVSVKKIVSSTMFCNLFSPTNSIVYVYPITALGVLDQVTVTTYWKFNISNNKDLISELFNGRNRNRGETEDMKSILSFEL